MTERGRNDTLIESDSDDTLEEDLAELNLVKITTKTMIVNKIVYQ